jgi:hypothetical protein
VVRVAPGVAGRSPVALDGHHGPPRADAPGEGHREQTRTRVEVEHRPAGLHLLKRGEHRIDEHLGCLAVDLPEPFRRNAVATLRAACDGDLVDRRPGVRAPVRAVGAPRDAVDEDDGTVTAGRSSHLDPRPRWPTPFEQTEGGDGVRGQRHRLQRDDVRGPVPMHPRAAVVVGDQGDPRAPPEAAALIVPGRRLHPDRDLQPREPLQRLGHDLPLQHALGTQRDVCELAPTHAARAGSGPGGRHPVG